MSRPFCNFHSALLVMGLLTPYATQASHNILFNTTDEEWIEGDFDLHDQDSLRDLLTETSRFAHRQQLYFTKSGSGFENETLIDYENVQTLESAYNLAGLYHLSPDIELYSGIEVNAESSENSSIDVSVNIDALYILKHLGSDRTYLGLGRQEVGDDRSWMIDDHIDGVTYVSESESFALTGFIGSHNQVPGKLPGTDEDTDNNFTDQYIAYGRVYRSLGDNKQGSAYIAYFSDSEVSPGESNVYIGLRSLGDFSENGSYWAEAALLSGSAEGRDIRAYAFDGGVSFTWDNLAFKPTGTLGFAFGSGDDGLGADSQFRQTGLHSNSTVFGGVVDLKYYGQVLDPQLSNLQVITAGLGFRPRERLSFDLLYNGYWQIHPSTDILADGIEFDANGTDHYIGSGIDLIAGLRNWNHLSISLVYGRFFGNDGITADVGSLELKWNFF